MKTITRTILLASAVLLASAARSPAVDGLGIEIQSTNLVLSWPSPGGNQQYLIQYRLTLDPSTPWTDYVSNYPANDTNRTTLTIYGIVPPPPDPGGTNDGGGDGGGDPPPMGMAQFGSDNPPGDDSLDPPIPPEIMPPSPDSMDSEESPTSASSTLNQPLLDDPIIQDPPPSSGFFRVFNIPDFSFNVTNYAYEGPTFLPLDFGDYIDRVMDVGVMLNGQPVVGAATFTNYVTETGDTNWGVNIHFEFYTNGTYDLQVATTLLLSDQIDPDAVFLVLSNAPQTIAIDNQVTFPADWNDLILGTNFTYRAQTKNTNTEWWIDIYDSSNAYVNGGHGYTTNGQIEWTWDLTDTQGVTRDLLDNDPFFSSYITFTPTPGYTNFGNFAPLSVIPKATKKTPAAQPQYPDLGNWLLTYLDRHYLDAGTNYPSAQQLMTNAMNSLRNAVSQASVPATLLPLKFGTSAYTQAQRNDSYFQLKAELFRPENRNFYYHGHANGNYLGVDIHLFDTNGNIIAGASLPGSKAYLDSRSVSNELTFNPSGGSRPYRFVWLDGCSSSTGGWPTTFGVSKTTNSLSFYTSTNSNPSHRRPSVFVGWNQTVGGQGWGNIQQYFTFRTEWINEWSQNPTTRILTDAFSNAQQNSSWPPQDTHPLWGAMQVFGYRVMKFNEFNRKSDWSWP